MPKAKKYTVRHRNRRRNRRYNKTKRGGMESVKPYTQFYPYDKQTGKIGDIRKPKFYDPTKMSQPNTKLNTKPSSIKEVEDVFSQPNPEEKERIKQAERDAEFKKLTQLTEDYNRIRNKESQERTNMDDDCHNGSCNISGGRKTRRYRRKGRKSRRH